MTVEANNCCGPDPRGLFAQHLGEERTFPVKSSGDDVSIIITHKELLFESSLKIPRARVEGRGNIINGIDF